MRPSRVPARVAAGVAACLVSLALAACGGGAGTGDVSPSATAPQSSAPQMAATVPAAAQPAATDATGARTPPVVTFTARDDALEGPSEVPAGFVKLVLDNHGSTPHQLQVLKLGEGKSVDDVRAALAGASPTILSWLTFEGGPNGVAPGGSGAAYVNLTEGAYAVADIFPTADASANGAQGMVAGLTVTPATAPMTYGPGAATSIYGKESMFAMSGPLPAGDGVVAFQNRGQRVHDLLIVRLDAGATTDDYMAALASGADATPPGEVVGGVSGVAPATTQTFEVTITPGHYAVISAMIDPSTGKPYYAQGMQSEFDVQ